MKNFNRRLWQPRISDQFFCFGHHKVYNNQMMLFWVVSNCFLGSLTSFWPRLTLYWHDARVCLHPNVFDTLWWMHKCHENLSCVIFSILLFDVGMHKCLQKILMGAMWKLKSKWSIFSLRHSTTFTWEMGLVWNLKMCWKFFKCWC